MPEKKRGLSPDILVGGGAKQKRINKNLVLTIFIFLFLSVIISVAGAAILNTLSGGESSKVLTFNQSGNQTDYLKLPESVNVISSAFNLQGLIYEVASLYQTLNSSDFDMGVYNQTAYNTTNNAVQLDLSYNSGDYTSSVLDTGQNSSYQNLSWTYQRISCPENMSYINKLNGYCIDKYEASALGCENVGNNCGNYTNAAYCPTICQPTDGVLGGVASTTGTTAKAYSRANVAPFVGVSQYQSRQMCANAGKHLCTDEEWLAAADLRGQYYNLPTSLSASPYYCVVDSGTYCNYAGNSNYACNTSRYKNGVSGCYSSNDVYDMTGNVWEWTNNTADVINPLGTVTAGTGTANWYYPNNTGGWQNVTSAATTIYGNDGTYFPVTTTGRAVLRGGYWLHGANAGPFCAYLYFDPSIVSYYLGFRCCSS